MDGANLCYLVKYYWKEPRIIDYLPSAMNCRNSRILHCSSWVNDSVDQWSVRSFKSNYKKHGAGRRAVSCFLYRDKSWNSQRSGRNGSDRIGSRWLAARRAGANASGRDTSDAARHNVVGESRAKSRVARLWGAVATACSCSIQSIQRIKRTRLVRVCNENCRECQTIIPPAGHSCAPMRPPN